MPVWGHCECRTENDEHFRLSFIVRKRAGSPRQPGSCQLYRSQEGKTQTYVLLLVHGAIQCHTGGRVERNRGSFSLSDFVQTLKQIGF